MGGQRRAGATGVQWQPGQPSQPMTTGQAPALAKRAALQSGQQTPQSFAGLLGLTLHRQMTQRPMQMPQQQAQQQFSTQWQIDPRALFGAGIFNQFGGPGNFTKFGGRY